MTSRKSATYFDHVSTNARSIVDIIISACLAIIIGAVIVLVARIIIHSSSNQAKQQNSTTAQQKDNKRQYTIVDCRCRYAITHQNQHTEIKRRSATSPLVFFIIIGIIFWSGITYLWIFTTSNRQKYYIR